MTKVSRKRYTEAENLAIISLREQGMTEVQIAEKLNRSINSIHCRIRLLREEGRLAAIRDTNWVGDDDLAELASVHGIPVDDVEYFFSLLGTKQRKSLELLDKILLAYNVQKGCCAYFGIPVMLRATAKGMLNMGTFEYDDGGSVLVVSQAAKKMRGKLSHSTFLKMVETIYKHVFAKS